MNKKRIEEILNIFQKEDIILYDKYKKIFDNIENQLKFEVGKWYKIANNWYAKFYEIHDNGKLWRFTEKITKSFNYVKMSDNLKMSDVNLLSIKLLTDLSEIQQYLPYSHPDKIVKSKHTFTNQYGFTFEEDKIYLYDNQILVRFKHEDKPVNITLGSTYSKTTNYSFNLSEVRLANQEEIEWFEMCEKADKFISKPIKQMEINEFKKGDYIVCLEKPNENPNFDKFTTGGAGFFSNYCFKIKSVSNNKNYQILWDGRLADCGIYSNSVRYATKEEIAEYDRLGKPFDVTTLNKELSDNEGLTKGSKVVLISISDHFSDCPGYKWGVCFDSYELQKEIIIDSVISCDGQFAYQTKCKKGITYLRRSAFKLIEKMTKEEILEKAKRDYPIGTVFKSALKNSPRPSQLIVTGTPFLDKVCGRDIVWNGDRVGFLYDDGKWAEIISKPQSTPINTYGLYVGMELPEDIINKWPAQGNNYYKGSLGWMKETGIFIGDRKILSFKELNGIIGFEVSGTLNLFLKAEGFKEFIDNFNKSKVEEQWIPKVGDWVVRLNNSHLGINVNQVCQIIKIKEIGHFVFKEQTEPEGSHNPQNIRKALPHEIPVDEYDVSSNSELPEKWCIRGLDKEDSVLINNYFNKGCNNNSYLSLNDKRYLHFPNYKDNKGFKYRYHADSNILKGYTEITFEQFKRLVLKENSLSVEIKTTKWTPEFNSLELPYQLNQVFETENNSNQPIYLEYQELKLMNYKQGQISQPILKKEINLQIIKIN